MFSWLRRKKNLKNEIRLTPPEYLYKYYSPTDYSFSSFLEKKLWMAKPRTLNDPFDIQLHVKTGDLKEYTEEILEKFTDTPVDIPNYEKTTITENGAEKEVWIDRTVETKLKNLPPQFALTIILNEQWWRFPFIMCGVSCFSEHQANPLMWAHYAAAGHGFVVRYKVPRFEDSGAFFKVGEQTLGQVRYVNLQPSLTVPDAIKDFDNLYSMMTCVKSHHWEYENEWRVITQFGDQLIDNPLEISEIYLGWNMAQQKRELLFDFGDRLGVRVLQIFPDPYSFKYVATAPLTKESLPEDYEFKHPGYTREISMSVRHGTVFDRIEPNLEN